MLSKYSPQTLFPNSLFSFLNMGQTLNINISFQILRCSIQQLSVGSAGPATIPIKTCPKIFQLSPKLVTLVPSDILYTTREALFLRDFEIGGSQEKVCPLRGVTCSPKLCRGPVMCDQRIGNSFVCVPGEFSARSLLIYYS